MNRNIAVVLSGRDAGLSRVLGAASGLVNSFSKDIQKANSVGAKAATAMKFAFLALGVGIAIAFGAAIKWAVDFQVQMQNVETVAHAGTEGLKSLSNSVLDLATKLPQNVTTLAKGLYDIASSGFYGADALNVLKVSAIAASAGLSTTAVASRAIVAVLNAYGLTAEDASDVSDILFKTVELGVVTFEDLATQIGDTIGSAAAAKISFDEVGSAIAAMSLAGLSASESTVSLNQLISKIIKPSKAFSEALRKLGFDSGQAALDQLGLHGTMELVRKATGGQISELIKLFPNIRAARGAYALLAADGANYARVQDQITSEQTRAGATQAAFNTQMKAVGNQFKVLTNNVQVLGIRVGTHFLPLIADAIELVYKFGARVGDAFSVLAKKSGPPLDALGRGLSEVARLMEVLGRTVSPVSRALGTLVAGATLAALQALGNGLARVAGFLADHPGLVRTVALLYGGILVGNLMSAVAAFLEVQRGLLAIRAGLAALTAQAVLQNIAMRLSAIGSSFYALFSTGNLQNLGNFTKAFQGLGAVLGSPLLAGVTLVAGLYAIQTAFDNARKQADQFIKEIEKPFDLKTLGGINQALAELQVQLGNNTAEWDKLGSSDVTKTLRGTLQVLTPMKNTVVDNTAEYKKLNAEIQRLTGLSARWNHDLDTVSNTLGITRAEVQSFFKELEYDPTDFSVTTTMLTDQIRKLLANVHQGTPATDAFVGALKTVGDPAATATDRVQALADAIDGLIGVELKLSNAAIDWEASFDAITTAVEENGLVLDITTEKGRAVASSINDAAEAALEHAKATAEETGSIAEGTAVLQKHRDELVLQLQSLGLSADAAQKYVDTLGLTPENISTFVTLENAQSAMLELDEFQYVLQLIDESEYVGKVNLDTSKFDGNFLKIGQALIQIEQANPEATVLLDGKPFKATADIVNQWAATWDAASPEAQALLSIIDPQHKFKTLQDAALHWDKARPTAQAKVNAEQANRSFYGIESRMNSWAKKSASARAKLIDNASTEIDRIVRKMAMIKDKTVTVTVVGSGGPSYIQRMGGVVHARSGLLQAGVANRPTVYFGERETGGEAFVPRHGNINRSRAVLDQAAGWYGMEVRPRGAGGDGSTNQDFSTQVTVNVNAQAIVDRRGLVESIQNVVKGELDEHDRKLARELASR